jgi:polyribonucleotide nucleotidyltransferase
LLRIIIKTCHSRESGNPKKPKANLDSRFRGNDNIQNKGNKMFNIVKKSIQWGGKTLEIETGRVARQADASVIIRYGKTSLLCVAVAAKAAKAEADFFPLTVVYQEKAFAAGKIPGGFFRREGKPTEKEILICRLIDRPIRPLFDENFKNETNIVATVLEFDGKNDSDIPAIIGASAALALSGLPFHGPIAAAKVGYVNGAYVLNPELGIENSQLEIVVAGTKTSVMMVESEAKELSEEQMLGAVEFAHKEMQPVIDLINEIAKEAGKPAVTVTKPDLSKFETAIKAASSDLLRAAFAEKSKQARGELISNAKNEAVKAATATLAEGETLNKIQVDTVFKKLEMDIVRGDLITTQKRIDGRTTSQVRSILAEVGVLPRTHGSALFTRGETQAIVVATLGTADDEQRIDSLEGDSKEHFMLHYNFPPYSVGEVGRYSGTGRREIGHGKLAWRAINPLLPTKASFPYTLRVVSEITESNGSSSMATVCGTSLALMDAGVPLAKPVAGIAMGLILEGEKFVVLSDILGDEDHLGDMDFKVAGTADGITSLQMDIKVQGITTEIMKQALAQAKEGRAHILGEMAKALSAPRADVSGNAPKFKTINIPVAKIREVIGSGGKVIREICEVSGAKIDIEQDGTIKVSAIQGENADKAIAMIKEICFEPEIGAVYDDCKVIKILEFGAIVQFAGKLQGLIHISELAEGRVEKVTDVLKDGDVVKAKITSIDKQGKIKLSIKGLNANSGTAPAANTSVAA